MDTDEGPQLMSRLLSFLSLSSLIMAMSFSAAPAIADKRVALVVGNGTYHNVARLDNPENDARLLADTLHDLGFALVGGGAQLDLDKAAFDRVVQDFGAQLQGADVGLFFYAGHGVQVRGTNYLIPVDANPTREADVDFQMLDISLVMRQMEGAGTRLNLAILDACRNNPFGGRGLAVGRGRDTESVRLRDAASGLAQMLAPEGTLISFATQPGSVARDGTDRHSPYSKALAETIRRPGLGIFDVFNQVGLEVKRATGGAQQPWVSSSPIDGTFYFVSPEAAGVQQAALPPRPPSAPASTAAPAVRTPVSTQDPQVAAIDLGTPPGVDKGQLTIAIKTELNRLGCYFAPIDSNWQVPALRKAIEDFAARTHRIKVLDDPAPELLEELKARGGRVCATNCGPREQERNGRCVAKSCTGAEMLGRDGSCVPRSDSRAAIANAAPRPHRTAPPATGHPGRGGCFNFYGRQFCE
jgi:hypothetical protein